MSEKESNFIDDTPENQKPHNISGKNPRSVQTLHKAMVKPKSQSKEIEIDVEYVENTTYKTKTTYLVQKAKMELKRRVAPGVSEIIKRKNEERRQKEAKAKAKVEEKISAKKEEIKEKVQKEVEKQEEKIANRSEPKEEVEKVVEEVKDKVTQAKEDIKTKTEETTTPKETTTDGKSFTQTLREQGLIQDSTTTTTTEQPKQETKETEETKETPKSDDKKDDGEVKTFIDLIRSEGLL